MFLFKVAGCTNYTVLRQAGHTQGDVSQSNRTCDRTELVTGWYRLQGVVADRIKDKCDSKGHYGVEYQGWLRGSHPTVTEGAVTRQVCFSGSKSCCPWKNLIKVKNCSSYYVYELHKNTTYHLCYSGNVDAGYLTGCLRCISWSGIK